MSKLDRSFISLYESTHPPATLPESEDLADFAPVGSSSPSDQANADESACSGSCSAKASRSVDMPYSIETPCSVEVQYSVDMPGPVDMSAPVDAGYSFTVLSDSTLSDTVPSDSDTDVPCSVEPSCCSNSPCSSSTKVVCDGDQLQEASEEEISEQDTSEESTVAFEAPVEEPFQPAYEVDRFTWPAVCEQLRSTLQEDLRRTAELLIGEAVQGRDVAMVTGVHAGAGSTTLAICLAAELAALDRSVILVDANLVRPDLAPSLGIAAPTGWETLGCGTPSVDKAIVVSLEDRVALLPVADVTGAKAMLTCNDDWSTMLDTLRRHYDVVLIDTSSLDGSLDAHPLLRHENHGVQCAILVESATTDAASGVGRLLQDRGVTPIGLVINEHEHVVPTDDDRAAYQPLTQPTA